MRAAPVGVLFVVSALLAACTGGHDAEPPATTTTALAPSITTALFRNNVDGELTIGVLLPQTGPGATIGLSMINAVEMAVGEINDAGGVFGRRIKYVVKDEGATTISAAKAFDELIAARVDAIVGPASSRVASSLIDRIKRNQVLMCSPTATAIALGDPNDDGYFIRTIPSDALQARVLAKEIVSTGYPTTTILYPNDDYGARFAAVLRDDLEPGTTVTAHAYDPVNPTDVDQVARATLLDDAATVAVLGDQSATRLIAALRSLNIGPPRQQIFVDDGMRHPDVSPTATVPAQMLEGLEGTSPTADPTPSSSPPDWYRKRFAEAAPDVPIAFTAYAYDCTNLLALSAVIANSDDAAHMRDQAIAASRVGQSCRDYAECSNRLGEKRDIDLSGASGDIDLDSDGDPTKGMFDVFSIEGGRDVPVRTVSS